MITPEPAEEIGPRLPKKSQKVQNWSGCWLTLEVVLMKTTEGVEVAAAPEKSLWVELKSEVEVF